MKIATAGRRSSIGWLWYPELQLLNLAEATEAKPKVLANEQSLDDCAPRGWALLFYALGSLASLYLAATRFWSGGFSDLITLAVPAMILALSLTSLISTLRSGSPTMNQLDFHSCVLVLLIVLDNGFRLFHI